MTEIRASTTGSVWKILVAVGDPIVRDQELAILESMKMEIPIEAEVNGRIDRILVRDGESVQQGQLLLVIKQ